MPPALEDRELAVVLGLVEELKRSSEWPRSCRTTPLGEEAKAKRYAEEAQKALDERHAAADVASGAIVVMLTVASTEILACYCVWYSRAKGQQSLAKSGDPNGT
jgi:hypothetical protein